MYLIKVRIRVGLRLGSGLVLVKEFIYYLWFEHTWYIKAISSLTVVTTAFKFPAENW